jgi:hypothetical protein
MSQNLFAAVRARRPRLDRLLAVLRQRATLRTVWRFVWLGPWVGLMVIMVPAFLAAFLSNLRAMPPRVAEPLGIGDLIRSADLFITGAYFLGGPPALVAGLLFAAWYHGASRPPAWPRRAALGALAGLGGCFAVGALGGLMEALGVLNRPGFLVWWEHSASLALSGVPAAVVVALLQKASTPPDEPVSP